jgi:hypothetical protein
MRQVRGLPWIAALLFLLWSGASSATPVVYQFNSGTLNVSATVAGSPVSLNGGTSVSRPLDGTSVTFDSAGPEVVDFEFTLSDSLLITLSPTVFGASTIQVTNLVIGTGSGYDGTNVSGSGPSYTFDIGPLSVSGDASINSGAATAFSIPSSQLTNMNGGLTLGSMSELSLHDITLAVLFDPSFPNDFSKALVLKGDLTFFGVVPEPGTALLVGFGLLLTSLRSRHS